VATATVERPRRNLNRGSSSSSRPGADRGGSDPALPLSIVAGLSDVIDEDEEDINKREDDDWDFVEAPGAEDRR